MKWRRAAALTGVATGTMTLFLLAPLKCETHFMRFVPGAWETETVSTSCRGIAAFHYQESKELVGPREPEDGTLPRPSVLQPQALITAVAVGAIVALVMWLIGDKPRLARPARWFLTGLLLLASAVSAIDPGGLVIYAAPVLVPLFWWVALEAGVIVRAVCALVAGFIAVEAIALFTYLSSNALIAPLLVGVGAAVVVLVLAAPRWRAGRGPGFPNS